MPTTLPPAAVLGRRFLLPFAACVLSLPAAFSLFRHGITGNSYWHERGGREEYMDHADLLLAPTLFERAARPGVKSARCLVSIAGIGADGWYRVGKIRIAERSALIKPWCDMNCL